VKDRFGKEIGRPLDSQGRPLKLVSKPFTCIPQERWDLAFGKKPKQEKEKKRG
jgi:hypothetical protein